MDNTIDLDHAIGCAFKLAHRMRAAQVSAGWDAVDKCFDPVGHEATKKRALLFASFLINPDERHLSSYALRAEALETALIAMDGVISRCRIGFQGGASLGGEMSEPETSFIKRAKNYITGNQVCKDAQSVLEQMIDLQTQLFQPISDQDEENLNKMDQESYIKVNP